MKVCVIGAGYVGMSLLREIVKNELFSTTVFDTSAAAIQVLSDKKFPVDARVVTEDEVKTLEGIFDIVIIAVPTPLKHDQPDLQHVFSASEMAVRLVSSVGVIALESTVGPGDTRRILGGMLAERTSLVGDSAIDYGFSPERVNPGDEGFNFRTTPKIVAANSPRALEKLTSFYSLIVDNVVECSSTEDAELAKLLENAYRLVNIALIDQIALAARGAGINITESIRLASTKPFGFAPFTPGIGIGGHCIPVDPKYLSAALSRFGVQSIIEEALSSNSSHPRRISEIIRSKILEDFSQRPNKKVIRTLIYGVTYKPNVPDIRNSAAVQVIKELGNFPDLEVHTFDPLVTPEAIPIGAGNPLHSIADEIFDVVIKLVDHSTFDEDLSQTKYEYFLNPHSWELALNDNN